MKILILLNLMLLFGFTACIFPDFDINDSGDPPVADFTIDKEVILPTEIVQFTDLSTGNPTSWVWDFGDDNTSILQNPTHQFNDFGSHDVSLTVTNSNGSNTVTIENCIIVDVQIGPSGSMTDQDGNTYKTIRIGNQVWMAENLRARSYASGVGITYIGNPTDWSKLELDDAAMSYYDFNIANAQAKGALYTHPAASNSKISTIDDPQFVQGVCPAGWHLPNDEEWQRLEINLGMSLIHADQYGFRGTDQGSKLAGGSSQWISGNLVNNPSFGYSGMDVRPYGYLSASGASLYLWEETFFWTASLTGDGNGDNAWSRRFLHDFAGVWREFSYKSNGMYVRCVKD